MAGKITIGEDFEQEVQTVLNLLVKRHRCAFARLYDTKSAGNLMPSQPADFVMEQEGVHVLLECKSSEKHQTMTRKFVTDNVGDSQAAGMRVWMRAGSNAFYLFKNVVGGVVELWPAEEVIHAHITPRYPPDRSKIIATCSASSEAELTQLLLSFCFKRGHVC